ncbi:hypothetical protein C2G38_2120377 [Gigaspora rosea]|uniref:Uncharacterized protein n=1 Tax=Gigaspora rosea TaxID=44941 RepID=A0A397UB76_9GLOM|nr:hypothetical protein C2G38_2120377 [Gigaspora rosea]
MSLGTKLPGILWVRASTITIMALNINLCLTFYIHICKRSCQIFVPMPMLVPDFCVRAYVHAQDFVLCLVYVFY